jgi:hypothetical protein
VIPPWEATERLLDVPVNQLRGMAESIGGILGEHRVHTRGDVKTAHQRTVDLPDANE